MLKMHYRPCLDEASKEVVDYCIKDGLYVIINQHWDGGWIEHNGMTANADIKTTKAQLTKYGLRLPIISRHMMSIFSLPA